MNPFVPNEDGIASVSEECLQCPVRSGPLVSVLGEAGVADPCLRGAVLLMW